MFNQKLRTAMQELNLNQAQVTGMTGIGKSSISQYLSGKNMPTEERQRVIAVSLGLESDYFSKFDDKVIISKSSEIQKITPREAGKLMGIKDNTVRKGLQQGVFPWGYGIKTSSNRWVYFINARRFADIEGIEIMKGKGA